jgi:surface polysaccharide O-acyltransferase-like enzyme
LKSTESFLRNIPGVSFVAILLVLLIHCRLNAEVGSDAKSFWVEELLVNGFARVAVPLFFFISGFLFFLKWDGAADRWIEKLRRRIPSLLIPYLISSAIGLTIIHFVSHDKKWSLANWLWNPAAFHLWFLRELMIFALFAWIWFKIPRTAKWIFLSLVAFAWLHDWKPHPSLSDQVVRALEGLLFYFLGAILAIDQRSSEQTIMERFLSLMAKFQRPLIGIWIVLTSTRFYLIHQQGVDETPLMLLLYKLAILSGTAAVLGYAARQHSIPCPSRDTTFFIYLYHLPLCLYLRIALTQFIPSESVVFVTTFLLTLAIPWIASSLLQKTLPKLHATLTGDRV